MISFFNDEENKNLIKSLLNHGIVIKKTETPSGKLTGKVVVFTGSMKHFSRGEATKLVKSLGAEVASSVFEKCQFSSVWRRCWK